MRVIWAGVFLAICLASGYGGGIAALGVARLLRMPHLYGELVFPAILLLGAIGGIWLGRREKPPGWPELAAGGGAYMLIGIVRVLPATSLAWIGLAAAVPGTIALFIASCTVAVAMRRSRRAAAAAESAAMGKRLSRLFADPQGGS
jgi:hypothetical protein